MTPISLAVLAFFFAADALHVSDAVVDEHGFRVHRVASEYQAGETLVRVLLPERLEPAERLRVLYLLPVEANSEHRYGDGLIEAKKRDLANTHRLICVAPTFSHLPWYADHPMDKTIRQETYFLKVVLPTVERLYPAVAERDGRLLVGFSKSGYGAWSLLLRHPEHFAKAAAWDAPLMKTAPDQFGMGPIYGTPENFAAYRLDNLLRDRADQLRARRGSPGPAVTMTEDFPNRNAGRPAVHDSAGSGDPRRAQAGNARLIHLGYGNFRDHHQRASALLDELRIPQHYVDGPKLEHTWHSGWLEVAVKALVESTKTPSLLRPPK